MIRSLMLNEETSLNQIIGNVQRYTTNSSFTVPTGAKSMDYFLVGGGGGGGSWNTWGYLPGMGGNGGQILNGNVKVTPGQVWSVQIGAGGAHASNGTAGAKSAQDGGSTYLSCGDTIFTAKGGEGGVNSVLDSGQGGLTAYEFIKQYGTYHIYTGELATYYQGPSIVNEPDDRRILNILGHVIVEDVNDLPLYFGASSDSYRLDDCGIPEFLEPGNPTHAASAITHTQVACCTTYGPMPRELHNGNDGVSTFSGGGYGGGGNPGYFRHFTPIDMGGDGTSGIVCVRFRN